MTAEDAGDGTSSDSVDSLLRAVAAAPARTPPESGAFASAFAVGAVVGRYVLCRRLGHGGMGTVWEAVHRVSGKRVALKIVREGLASAAMQRRFENEARLVTAVRHPGVVEVHDVFAADDGSPVLAMELLHGETLGAALARGPLTAASTAAIVADVFSIVRAAHAASVVHRDLKPENIFLCHEGARGPRVRVLDFGIARATGIEAAQDPITRPDALVGTPQYMAPEQLFGESDVDERADVWALGVILYECIKGARPIDGGNVALVARNLSRDGVPELPSGSCPDPIRSLVRRMMAFERDDRLSDLERAEECLREWGAGRLEGHSRRPRWAIAAGVAAMLCGGVAYRALTKDRVEIAASNDQRALASANRPAITIATEVPRGSAASGLLGEWRRVLSERTGGRVALQLRWPSTSGYRGGERSLVTRLRTMQVDGALLGARALRVSFPEVAGVALPGIADSWTKGEWIRDYLRDHVKQSLLIDGYRLLAFAGEGCERVMTRGHAVRRPSDLARSRLAALDGDPVAPLLASVAPGIVSVGLAAADVADALLDGTRSGATAVVATAMEAERYQWTRSLDAVTQPPVLCGSGALLLRTGAYDRLSAEDRLTIDETARRFEEQAALKQRKEDVAASLRLFRSVSVVEPGILDRKEWRRVLQRAASRPDGPVPPALVEEVVALSHDIDVLE